MDDPLRERLGHARAGQLRCIGARGRRQRRQRLRHGGGTRREACDRCRDVERTPPVAEEPPRRAFEQNTGAQQHVDLRLRGDPAVECLDLGPEARQVEDLTGGCVRAGEVGGAGAGLVAETEREGRTRAVDEVVDDA